MNCKYKRIRSVSHWTWPLKRHARVNSHCQSANQINYAYRWNWHEIISNFRSVFVPNTILFIRMIFIVLLLCLQCRRWICGNNVNESGTPSHWSCLLDAAGDFQIVLRNRCSIFSIWPANMLHEVRLLDVRRRSGKLNRGRHIINFCSKNWTQLEFNSNFASNSASIPRQSRLPLILIAKTAKWPFNTNHSIIFTVKWHAIMMRTKWFFRWFSYNAK